MIRLAVAVTPVDALDEHAGPFDDDDGPVHNGRFGLLPCVRTHSRFGPKLHSPGWRRGGKMTTLLIIVVLLFVLGGGGWGYSRWRG